MVAPTARKWFGAMIAASNARCVAAFGTRFEEYLTTDHGAPSEGSSYRP